jgi:hypothetical protein
VCDVGTFIEKKEEIIDVVDVVTTVFFQVTVSIFCFAFLTVSKVEQGSIIKRQGKKCIFDDFKMLKTSITPSTNPLFYTR